MGTTKQSNSMDTNPRQSTHEIGVARKLVLAPGRPEVVLVGSSSRTTTPSQLKTGHEEVREEAGHGIYHVQNQAEQNERKFKFFMFCVNHCSQRCFADSLLQVESGNASHPGASRRAVRPRLAFMMDEDDWPLFSNPECTHQRHCGHAAVSYTHLTLPTTERV